MVKRREKGVHTKRKKVCTQNDHKKKKAEEVVEKVIENADLTDKQRLFCVYYIRSFNATKAYQKHMNVATKLHLRMVQHYSEILG